MLPPGTIVGERHRIVRELGAGGMGRVYEAEHVALRLRVAVKVLRGDRRSGDLQARFRQEAEAASRVGHPAIVGITDFAAPQSGLAYMVMELLRGESLEDWLERPGRLTEVLPWLLELCRGLHAAHAAGVVHRDLKPANLFLHRGTDGRVQPKILDFGIAKISTTDHTAIATAAGTLLGTPYYLAPERALGRPLDGRADLYSLGVVLYEILTGTLPFLDANYMGVLVKHVREMPLDPRQAAAGRDIPDGIAQLTMALLAKDPQARPADAATVAAAIERCMQDEGAAIARVLTGPRGAAERGGATVAIDEISARPTAVPGATGIVGDGAARRSAASNDAAIVQRVSAPTRALGSNGMRDGLPPVKRWRGTPLLIAMAVVCGGASAGWAIARGGAGTADSVPSVAPAASPPAAVATPAAVRPAAVTPPAPIAPAVAPWPTPDPPPPPATPSVTRDDGAQPPAAIPIKRRRPKPKSTTPRAPAAGGPRPPPLK